MADGRIAIACMVDAAHDVATITTQSPLAVTPDHGVTVPFHAIEALYLQILSIRLQRQQAVVSGGLQPASPEQVAAMEREHKLKVM